MKLNKSIDNKLGQTIPQGELVKILIDEGEQQLYKKITGVGIGARGDVVE